MNIRTTIATLLIASAAELDSRRRGNRFQTGEHRCRKWARHRCARRRPFRRNCRRSGGCLARRSLLEEREASACSSSAMSVLRRRRTRSFRRGWRTRDVWTQSVPGPMLVTSISSPICIASRVTFRSRQMKPFFQRLLPSTFVFWNCSRRTSAGKRFGSAVSQIRVVLRPANGSVEAACRCRRGGVVRGRCSLRSARD